MLRLKLRWCGSATLAPLWVTKEDTLAPGEDGVFAEGSGGPWRSPVEGFRGQVWSLTFYFCWEEEHQERMEGRAERRGVWVQQEVQMRDVINPRVPFPASLPFLMSIPLLSFLLISASCSARLWTLPSIHSPIIPLHLSFTLLLFSISPSIIHTHGAPGLWLSAAAW